MSDDDRINYLAGEPAGVLEPAERADLDDLRSLLAEPAVWAEPGPGLEDAVIAAVAAAGGGRADAGRVAGTDRSAPAHAARRGRRPRLIAVLAGVTAVAAAAAIALTVSLGGGSHPAQYQAALAGTPLDPAASAQVTLTQTQSGWRITLHGHGLPRLDNGYYYEAWLKNRAGILVPIGTFNQPDDVTLWSGVPPTQYPVIAVTRQQADGNPASSGERVLAGTARPAG